jgi:Flp pilus assembly protein TadG
MKKQRGSVILEMAFVLPILLLLILGGIDVTFQAMSKSSLNYVAEETARCVVRTPAQCPDGQAYATQITNGLTVIKTGPVGVTIVPQLGGAKTVTVAVTWQPVSPFFTPRPLVSTATATP